VPSPFKMAISYERPTNMFEIYMRSQSFQRFKQAHEIYSARVIVFHEALEKVDIKIAALLWSIKRGRNVDAVDEMAKYEAYREQAITGLRHSCDVLYNMNEIVWEMEQIVHIERDDDSEEDDESDEEEDLGWEHLDGDRERLFDFLPALKQFLEHEEATRAIINYLPQDLLL